MDHVNNPKGVARWWRWLWLPLLLLGNIPILETELGWLSPQHAVFSVISDINYLGNAAFASIQGRTPYVLGFMTGSLHGLRFVYPPLSLGLAIPPTVLGMGGYDWGFSLEVAILGGVGLWLIRIWQKDWVPGFWVPILVLMAAAGPILLTRLDAVQAVLLVGMVAAMKQRRIALSLAWLGLAILIKETVVLLTIPWLWWWVNATWTDWRGRWRGLALGMLPSLLILAGVEVWSKGHVGASVLASLSRGLEIESLPAAVALALRGWWAVHTYHLAIGSLDIRTVTALPLVISFIVLGVGGLIWGLRQGVGEHNLATACAFVMGVSLVATPVLSPQFLLVFLALLAVAVMVELPTQRNPLLLEGLFIGLGTQIEFPYMFEPIIHLQMLGLIFLWGRNLLLVLVTWQLGRALNGTLGATDPERLVI